MIDPTIYGFNIYHSDKVPGLLMWRRGNIVIYPLPDLTGLPGEKNDENASWVIDTHNKSKKNKPYLLTDNELLEFLRDIKVDQIVKK
jgi:hypothetical protein